METKFYRVIDDMGFFEDGCWMCSDCFKDYTEDVDLLDTAYNEHGTLECEICGTGGNWEEDN